MGRLILGLCVLGLLSGCGGKGPTGAASGTASGSGSKTGEVSKRVLQGVSPAIQVAEDHLAESNKGSEYEILMHKELQTTCKKMPATAVFFQWKLKGEAEPKNEIILVQDGRVRTSSALTVPYDTKKTLEENVAALVKDFETP